MSTENTFLSTSASLLTVLNRSRSRIVMPFPDAVPTPGRRLKQGKYLHSSAQQADPLEPPLSSVGFSRPPLQNMTPNIKHDKSPNAEQTESEHQHQRSTSNTSTTSGEWEYHQRRNSPSAEAQPIDRVSHEKGDPKKGSSHRSSSSMSVNCNQLEHPGRGHPPETTQAIDRGRTRDNSVTKEPLSYSKQFLAQESDNFLVSAGLSVGALRQPSSTRKSSNELLDVVHSNGDFQNLYSDIASAVSVHHEQEGMIAIEYPVEPVFDHKAAPNSPSMAEDSFRVSWHAQSKLHSRPPSRPPSRRSNSGKAMSRPLSANNLQPTATAGVDPRALQPTTSAKVKKTHSAVKHLVLTQGLPQKPRSIAASELMLDYHKFVANGAQYIEILHDYERQGEFLEAQKAEINLLKMSDQSTKQQLLAVQAEKSTLNEKIKKLMDLSSKYRKHMNDVVKGQKFLKTQAVDFQKATKEIVNTYRGTESLLQKIRVGIEEVKAHRASIEAFGKFLLRQATLILTNSQR